MYMISIRLVQYLSTYSFPFSAALRGVLQEAMVADLPVSGLSL